MDESIHGGSFFRFLLFSSGFREAEIQGDINFHKIFLFLCREKK